MIFYKYKTEVIIRNKNENSTTKKVTISSTDTNTTYSVGDGGLSQKNFTTALFNKLNGITAGANVITNNNQIANGAGYTTNTGTTTASNSQTFTNKGGNISQWTNDSNYVTTSGFVNGSGNALIASTGTFNGAITSTGNITAFVSDMRLKDRKSNISDALEKVESLSGFNYTLNDKAIELMPGQDKDESFVGVSAQEVEKVLPEAVKPAPVNGDYKTVQYEKLVPLLIEAIKELNAEIKELKKHK